MENLAPKVPAEIRKAIQLIIASMALGLVRFAFTYEQTMEKISAAKIPGVGPWVFIILTTVAAYGFNLWLIFLLSRRKNWARILFATLFVVGLPMSASYLTDAFNLSVLSGLIGILQLGLQFYGVILLFKPASNAWFKKPQEPGAPAAT